MQLNIKVLAQAYSAYVAAFPTSARFIAASVPGIICNRYFSNLPDFDYEKFIQWSVKTPGWGVPIEKGFSSASELVAAIAFIRGDVSKVPNQSLQRTAFGGR